MFSTWVKTSIDVGREFHIIFQDDVCEDSVKDVCGIEEALERFYRKVSVTVCSAALD